MRYRIVTANSKELVFVIPGATYCITLQHTAAHCNTLQHHMCDMTHSYAVSDCDRQLESARFRHARCNTLLHIATQCSTLPRIATYCITLLHTAAHCCTLQHHMCDMAHSYAVLDCDHQFKSACSRYVWCNTLSNTATHCNTLQHIVTQCNTVQHASCDMTYPTRC